MMMWAKLAYKIVDGWDGAKDISSYELSCSFLGHLLGDYLAFNLSSCRYSWHVLFRRVKQILFATLYVGRVALMRWKMRNCDCR